jgi:hypothetical protein
MGSSEAKNVSRKRRETFSRGKQGNGGSLSLRDPRIPAFWPNCSDCRYDGEGECGYEPSRPWTKSPPADVGFYGFCGYWHGYDGETIRQRVAAVVDAVKHTRPPVDS